MMMMEIGPVRKKVFQIKRVGGLSMSLVTLASERVYTRLLH